MEEQNNWKEEFYKICKQLNLREETVSGFDEIGLMQNFISSLLSSQAHALKEQMKACVPDKLEYDRWDIPEEDYKKYFNDCREQTLSAIESIEI